MAQLCAKSWICLVLWDFFDILMILPAAMVSSKFEVIIAEYFHRVILFGK